MALDRLFERLNISEEFQKFITRTTQPEYLYWDKVRYLPRPEGLGAEEFWFLVKLLRKSSAHRLRTPIKSEKGEIFSWQLLPAMPKFLHDVDMRLGGALVSGLEIDQKEKQRFISRGIIEEAIASSQLEGANTTRKAAKQLIIEQRDPRSRSEQMILNNYTAMLKIEDDYKNRRLDRGLLIELHVMLVKNTIDRNDVGRLREDSDGIVVSNASDGNIYHVPPRRAFLDRELDRLVQYANDELLEKEFIHPVVKAIALHFWIGYLHPFVDGNGRLARALFYWYLLKRDYWGISYLPLSRVIKNSPAQYRDAYVYSEQDEHDLTYFIDYNIRKIIQATRDFDLYVTRKQAENQGMARVARTKFQLNDRQIQLLRYLYKNAGASTTINLHARVYGIARLTAQSDLRTLEKKGFLESKRLGRERPFQATPKIDQLFKHILRS
jgi:Fic family protein